MEIKKFYSGDYQCNYEYKNEKETIKLLLYYFADKDFAYQLSEQGELITLQDRKILVSGDSVYGEPWVSVYTETCNIDISGISEKDQLIEIGKRMTK